MVQPSCLSRSTVVAWFCTSQPCIKKNPIITGTENKKYSNTKAGYYQKLGFKSVVRGVAMNPVDHPHGGRTKAIKYQRTP